MQTGERLLCDAATMERLIDSMAHAIAGARSEGAPLRLVGIRTRGVTLAERLAAKIHEVSRLDVPVGAVDITLYRDDLARGQTWPVLHGTEIPFAIEGAGIVLVDDVLYTGRTIRAALNAICDLGRPASVRLAVLVDRGHRELPIRADFVGIEVATDRHDHVRVRLEPVDSGDEIVADGSAAGRHSPADERPAS